MTFNQEKHLFFQTDVFLATRNTNTHSNGGYCIICLAFLSTKLCAEIDIWRLSECAEKKLIWKKRSLQTEYVIVFFNNVILLRMVKNYNNKCNKY